MFYSKEAFLAAIHLFISSHDEIKDFCSMDKKTGRRYDNACHIIQLINTVICEEFSMRISYDVCLFLNVITHNRVFTHIPCVAM